MPNKLLYCLVPVSLFMGCDGDLGEYTVVPFAMDGQAVHAVAAALVQQRAGELGLGRNDVARQRSVFIDELGLEHVRYEREYHGLPVIGGDFIIHPSDRQVDALTAQLAAPIPVSHVPTLTKAQAIAVGEQAFPGVHKGSSAASLVIYAVEGPAKLALAYDVVTTGTAADGTPSVLHSFVDAHDGRLLLSYDEIETTAVTGSGHGLYSGVVTLNDNQNGASYELVDTTRGNGQTVDASNGNKLYSASTNTWGNGTSASPQSAAVDAHYGAAMTWDYYQTTHSRSGIANDGKPAQNRVHYGTSYNNAFWADSCFCMTYGDGDGKMLSPLVALDVTGHEMTHGVTSRTARLIYAGESGGLNEGSSDIMGISVKFFARNATTTGNYLIGDKLVLSGTNRFLRSMSDPRVDGHSIDHYSLYKSSLDVHYASGIANNFFYLLSEGGTNRTSGQTVAGISRAKAEKIWYRALTSYFTSSTNYSAARKATVKAAADLFGGPTSAEAVAVGAVWDAVGVK